MANWQDIATAPKDGTRILVWWPYWSQHPSVARFHRGRWDSEINVCDDGDCALPHKLPTHWIPLPEPPK